MRVSYIEELATHSGPESCGFPGNREAEALTGEHIGRAIELRNHLSQGADLVLLGVSSTPI